MTGVFKQTRTCIALVGKSIILITQNIALAKQPVVLVSFHAAQIDTNELINKKVVNPQSVMLQQENTCLLPEVECVSQI